MTNHIVKVVLDAKQFIQDLRDCLTRRETTPVDIVRMADISIVVLVPGKDGQRPRRSEIVVPMG